MTEISLNSVRYTVKRDAKGVLQFTESRRPSQPFEGRREYAEWLLDGPAFNSAEDISQGRGLLSCDQTINCDTRWEDVVVLGPEFTEVELDGSDDGNDDIENTHGVAIAYTANGTPVAYWLRGSRTVKQDLTDMTIEETFQHNSGNAKATSVIATSTGEVAIALDTQPYRVITAIANPGGSDTESENDDAEDIRIFGQGDDRVFGLGGTGNERRISGNILAGAVTMDAPDWQTVTTIDGPPGQGAFFTGFTMDKELPVIGTVKGPYLLNQRFGRFFPIRTDLAASPENCREMTEWFSPLNTSIPLVDSVRSQVHGDSRSWGLETYPRLDTSIGRVTAQDGNGRWFRTAFTDDGAIPTSLIIDWRPTRPSDLDQAHIMQPFPIRLLVGDVVRVMRWVDTLDGKRTNPTWIMGKDDHMVFQTAGRTAHMHREYEDSNYRFVTSGTWTGTTMRRHDKELIDLEAVDVTTEDCDADQTITVGYSTDGGNYTDLEGTINRTGGATLNGVINTSGYQRVLFIDNNSVPLTAAIGARTFKPRLKFATDTNTASPKTRGYLRLTYRVRPELIDVHEITIDVNDSAHKLGSTVEETAETLLELQDNGPFAFNDLDGNISYAHVDNAVADYSGSPDQITVTLRLSQVATTEDD